MSDGYPKLERAIRFAAKAHRGFLKDGPNPLPYIVHPVEVVLLLRHVGGVLDEDVLCAGALHDTLEWSDVEPEQIRSRFGKRVLALVREMTRREPTPDEIAGRSKDEVWELRSRMLLAEIEAMSPAAQTIKLADRCSNLQLAFEIKKGPKLARTLAQTETILRIVDRSVCPGLWDRLRQMLDRGPAGS
ncbi:MAG: HD domain-containing protein [Fimbriimonadaceae bacterium]